MAVTTIKEQEWNHIMVPILKASLPLSGIERNFPRDVLYGPKRMQGFGILHPWYHQEIVHLLVCLKQTTIGGITGGQISASTEQMRLEAGLSGWFTDHNFDTYEALLTDSWIKTVWQFAHRFRLAIHDSEAKLRLHRSNDRFLMEEFATAGYRAQELSQLNTCRMFLHAVTLSDIVTVNGSDITLSAWEGRRSPTTGSNFSWPRVQLSLPVSYWKTWQRALRKCFMRPGSSRLVRQHLGSWAAPPTDWQWFYSPREDRLYKKEALLWRPFPRLLTRTSPRRGMSKYRSSESTTRTPAEDLEHASVDCQHGIVTKVSTLRIPAPIVAPTQLLLFDVIRRNRPVGFSWAIS